MPTAVQGPHPNASQQAAAHLGASPVHARQRRLPRGRDFACAVGEQFGRLLRTASLPGRPAPAPPLPPKGPGRAGPPPVPTAASTVAKSPPAKVRGASFLDFSDDDGDDPSRTQRVEPGWALLPRSPESASSVPPSPWSTQRAGHGSAGWSPGATGLGISVAPRPRFVSGTVPLPPVQAQAQAPQGHLRPVGGRRFASAPALQLIVAEEAAGAQDAMPRLVASRTAPLRPARSDGAQKVTRGHDGADCEAPADPSSEDEGTGERSDVAQGGASAWLEFPRPPVGRALATPGAHALAAVDMEGRRLRLFADEVARLRPYVRPVAEGAQATPLRVELFADELNWLRRYWRDKSCAGLPDLAIVKLSAHPGCRADAQLWAALRERAAHLPEGSR